MKGNWKPGVVHKHKCGLLLKMGVMILATALVLRLFLYRPTGFSPQTPLLRDFTSTAIGESPASIFSKSHLETDPEPVQFSELVEVSNSDNSVFNLNDGASNKEELEQVTEPVPGSSNNYSISNLNDEGSDKAQEKVAASSENNSESNLNDGASLKEKCDPFMGDWIPNPTGPAYTNETCDLIESPQDCMKNGRPDLGYLYWRWRPRNCELPPFDAKRFLEMMRNKTWALIGDSISRNHVQSLVCTLSQVEKPEFIYHDEGWKSRGWKFPSYNVAIYVLWSPFLVEASEFVENRDIDVHLDRLDKKWTEEYQNLDYMIFSTGKWFLRSAVYYENNTIVGCHYCVKKNQTEVGFEFAYRKALSNTLNFLATSGHRGLIFFRTSTPDHFEGGAWHSGGYCNSTIPFKEGETELRDIHTYLRRVELEEFDIASAKASENGVRLKLLDFMPLSLLRPDGHPGPYRQPYPFANDKNAKVQNDCLHWCLPGPIDSWNDIIMNMVVNG